jgi:hypothetical protein
MRAYGKTNRLFSQAAIAEGSVRMVFFQFACFFPFGHEILKFGTSADQGANGLDTCSHQQDNAEET